MNFSRLCEIKSPVNFILYVFSRSSNVPDDFLKRINVPDDELISSNVLIVSS